MKKPNRRKKTIKKSIKKRKSTTATSNREFVLLSYDIVDEPIIEEQYDKLPTSVKEQAEDLYELVHTAPHKALHPLLELSEKYPHIPQFKNHISAAYVGIGELEKADDMTLEIYQEHPDYLFGKLNYAHICLQKGEGEKVAEILNNKFDLKALYPHRNKFHITEYTTFTGVVALYYLHIGQIELAKRYYNSLQEVAPNAKITGTVRKRFVQLGIS